MRNRNRDLEQNLRRHRPRPSDDLVNRLESRIASSGSTRRGGLRLVPALVVSLVLLVVLASVGGIGDARGSISRTVSSAVQNVDRLVTGTSDTPANAKTPVNWSSPRFSTLSHFHSSHVVYPRPKLICAIISHNRRMRVLGVTTVNQGTISVLIEKVGGGSDPSFPWLAPSLAVTSFVWGPTAQSPQGRNGRTYRATVIQTAAGYDPGVTHCFIRFHGRGNDWEDWDDDNHHEHHGHDN